MAKYISRSTRWQNAVDKVRQGLEELTELKSEYEDWQGNLPENLEASPLGEKLSEVVDSGFCDDIENAVSDAESLELPQGFGRD
tara:strand:+ start:349 stop:600 length:252 start_codon:yes stop_codon:yes gene_type:complete